MNDCERAYDLMSQYIDGNISDIDKDFLSAHIKNCPECAELFSIYAEVSFIMADDAEPPDELLPNVMNGVNKINAEHKASGGRKKIISIRWLAAAACIALVLMIGIKTLPKFDVNDNAIISDSAIGTAESIPEDSGMSLRSAGASEDETVNDSDTQAEEGALAEIPEAKSSADSELSTSVTENHKDTFSIEAADGASVPATFQSVDVEDASSIKAEYGSIVYVSQFPDSISEDVIFTLEDGSLAAEVSGDELQDILAELEDYEILVSEEAESVSDVALLICKNTSE